MAVFDHDSKLNALSNIPILFPSSLFKSQFKRRSNCIIFLHENGSRRMSKSPSTSPSSISIQHDHHHYQQHSHLYLHQYSQKNPCFQRWGFHSWLRRLDHGLRSRWKTCHGLPLPLDGSVSCGWNVSMMRRSRERLPGWIGFERRRFWSFHAEAL
jgi:hypothetical protein